MNELLDQAKTFWKSAELIYKTKDYTSAAILYFKSLFVLTDWIIFQKKRITPKDHTERFRILQEEFPGIYTILDKIFPIYRSTYSIKIEKEQCDEVRKNATKLAKEQKI